MTTPPSDAQKRYRELGRAETESSPAWQPHASSVAAPAESPDSNVMDDRGPFKEPSDPKANYQRLAHAKTMKGQAYREPEPPAAARPRVSRKAFWTVVIVVDIVIFAAILYWWLGG